MQDALLLVALFGILTSSVYLGLVLVAAWRFRRRAGSSAAEVAPWAHMPAVTLLKPLHGMESRLRENLESFFRQDYPAYEIVFGVRDADDPAISVVHEVARRYPRVPVKVTFSGVPDWPNAKVHNLQRMLHVASHDVLVISDSDVQVVPDYVRAVTRPLLDREVGLVTCLYRGVPSGGMWSHLEAMGMSVELTSGVLVANMLEGMKFALGPTMATRRDCLAAIGGFQTLAEYLADDYVLGNLVHAAGYRVVLSDHVIEHHVINRSLFSSLAHQVRWAKSTRRSRPKGHFGAGLTYSVPFALLGFGVALADGEPLFASALLAAGVLNRVFQCFAIGYGVVGDRYSRSACLLYPMRDLLGFLLWATSFVGGSHTTWRGVRYRIHPGGRMVPEPQISLNESERTAA
jgi:ceramide glucosyltransferase